MEQNHNPSPPPPPRQESLITVIFPTVEPVLTYLILGFIGVIFFYINSTDTFQEMVDKWAKINSRIIEDGEYYRLFTSMFLHLDVAHIGFNGLALYIFGREVETLFGHVRFALIYVLGGLTGSIASLLYVEAPSIGASGAIFAVFGASGVYWYYHKQFYGQIANARLRQMAALAAINIFFGLAPGTNIDNAAHLGGLAGGLILAWFIAPKFKPQPVEMMTFEVEMKDTNTLEQWLIAPIVYSVCMVIWLFYATSGG